MINTHQSKIAAAGLVVLLTAGSAFAATGNVPFAGIVASACVLTVGTPGVLAPNSDYTSLSSTQAGGAAGTISALTTSPLFDVSLDNVSAFTTGDSTNVTFSSTYQATGATTIGSTPGSTATDLNTGLTNLSVNLSANKSTGNFGAGAYTALVTVRCE